VSLLKGWLVIRLPSSFPFQPLSPPA